MILKFWSQNSIPRVTKNIFWCTDHENVITLTIFSVNTVSYWNKWWPSWKMAAILFLKLADVLFWKRRFWSTCVPILVLVSPCERLFQQSVPLIMRRLASTPLTKKANKRTSIKSICCWSLMVCCTNVKTSILFCFVLLYLSKGNLKIKLKVLILKLRLKCTTYASPLVSGWLIIIIWRPQFKIIWWPPL